MMPSARSTKLLGLIAILAALVSAALMLPLGRWTITVVGWIREAGAVGVLVFALSYVLAAVFFLPGSALTLGAGFAYGPALGTLIVSPASVLAATVAFLLGRTALRGWVTRRVAGDHRLSALDKAVGEQGLKIVLLLRLSPIFPFNVLNYVLGITSVRPRDYVVGSFLGMLPGTILYVYLGSLATSAAELSSGASGHQGPWKNVLYWGGLACTLAVTALVTRVARRALSRSLNPQQPSRTSRTSDLPEVSP